MMTEAAAAVVVVAVVETSNYREVSDSVGIRMNVPRLERNDGEWTSRRKIARKSLNGGSFYSIS